MATLYIAEYPTLPNFPNLAGSTQPQIALEGDSVTDQTVALSGVSAQSAAFQATTNYIAVTSDSTWSRDVGVNPTATTSTFRIQSGIIIFYAVKPGDKIAGIVNT